MESHPQQSSQPSYTEHDQIHIQVNSTVKYSNELISAIKQTVAEHAKFEHDDVVTVEPKDHSVPYVGQQLEGVPLTIEKAIVNFHSFSTGSLYPIKNSDKAHPNQDTYPDSRYIKVPESEEFLQGCEWLLLVNIQYAFYGDDLSEFCLSETTLISWDEYRSHHQECGMVNYYTGDNDRHHYTKQDKDFECDMCGSSWVEVCGGPYTGQKSCAVCSHTVERWN